MESLDGLDEIGRASDPTERLKNAWSKILQRDYEPVFRPALAVLENLPNSGSSHSAVRTLASSSHNLADSLNDLGYDHAGPLYHSILGTAKSDGAFYTNNISALMLAGLALSPDLIDWSSKEAITNLRILDPACGTGTLLMAAVKTIKERGLAAGAFGTGDLSEIHKGLVESTVTGLDINFHATQLAASNLTLGAPAIEYDSINIHTLQHGPQQDGGVRLGSLELLPDAFGNDVPNLFEFAKQAQLEQETTFARNDAAIQPDVHESPVILPDMGSFDIVLMNPPFSRNNLRNSKFPEKAKEDMQQRELTIRDRILKFDQAASESIDANSARTFFTPLAEALIGRSKGTLAKVLPVTALVSTSGVAERRYLARNFHIEFIVTSHDPKYPNFSENTSIHESLLICRRVRHNDLNRPTRFIALNKMPKSSEEVAEWLEAVHAGMPHRFHSEFSWPRDRVVAGDWTPAQYYDGQFAEIARNLESTVGFVQLGHMAQVEPAGRRVSDAFVNPFNNTLRGRYPILWNHKTDKQRTMLTSPDCICEPKLEKKHYAEAILWPKASRLLFAKRLRTNTVRTSAVFLTDAVLGQAWVPVRALQGLEGTSQTGLLESWCAWFNSTPAVICLLNRRQKSLNYSNFSLEQLRTIPAPSPEHPEIFRLYDAYYHLKTANLRPWPEMNKCPVRTEIDKAACAVAQLDPKEVADWRERLVREPTISNKSAA